MTAHARTRSLLAAAAVAALAAPLAVAVIAAPADAAGNVGPRKHEVTIYKVEKHVDLSGEYPDDTLDTVVSCDNGDIALDGMWRVDHVDQYNPDPDDDENDSDVGTYNDERDVHALASYPDASFDNDWHFSLENDAWGNAQVKLFVTCIQGRTAANQQHDHGIVVGNVLTQAYHASTAGTTDFVDSHVFNKTCPAGQYLVAPGFSFTGNDVGRLVGSWPQTSGRSWSWQFVHLVGDATPEVTVYGRCLSKRVQAANPPGEPKNHQHVIAMSIEPNGWPGYLRTLSWWQTKQERTFTCDQDKPGYYGRKAAVGAFWIDNPWDVWFLGMDPRPKTRAFSFWNGAGGSPDVHLGALCVNSRTGKQVKP